MWRMLGFALVPAVLILVAYPVVIRLNALGGGEKVDRAKADVQTIAKAAMAYQIKHGQLPGSLLLLIQPPGGALPYLDGGVDGIKDPWGQLYGYNPAGTNNGGRRPDVWTVTPGSRLIANWRPW